MSVLQFIARAVPPPRYATLPAVGVDISDTSLKYIQFERTYDRSGHLKLAAWGDVDIPVGVLERGHVHEPAKLVDAIRAMKDATKTEYVRVSLPEERAYLFETTVRRGLSKSEARDQIEFRLEENVPLSPRDTYFNFDVVRDASSGSEQRVAVAVYARETINTYFDACRNAGVVPLSFEIEAEAIARAAVDQSRGATQMIIDFGKTRMGVGIVHRGVLMYTSTIDVSGMHLSEALRAVLGDRPESELTEIKNTRGLLQSGENRAVYEALRPIIETATEELRVRIHYWQTRDADESARSIEAVILCGGSANLYGLPEHLSVALGVPVERASVWQKAFPLSAFIPPISRRYSYGYATAIGLALKDFDSVIV
jgi:type IV pilus assembly protein PilM